VYSAFTRMTNFDKVKDMSVRNQGRSIEIFSEDDLPHVCRVGQVQGNRSRRDDEIEGRLA
jgi:hypothetical protein